MSILRINQVESGLDKLLEQFKGKYNIESVLTSYLQITQSTQDTYEEMLDERSLTTAVGDQLDMIGALVGEGRNLRDDDEYRTAIFIRIAINTSDGTLPSIVEIVELLTGSQDIRIFEHYPASIYIYLADLSTLPSSTVVEAVEKILPAGVSLGYIGYADNPLAFTPYSQEYGTIALSTNTSDSLITSTEENIVVKREIQTILAEQAWLAESSVYDFSDFVDEVGDNIVDEVGDIIVVYDSEPAPNEGYGILVETI